MNPAESKIHRLALGTVQFGLRYGVANRGPRVAFAAAKQILQHARAAGIDTIDTAIAYGDSEQRLGEIGLRGLRVLTKLPGIPEDCGDVEQWMTRSVRESMDKLKVDRLAGLLLHRPLDLLTPAGGRLHAGLEKLQRDGIAEKIGVSIYDPSELDAVCGRFRIDVVQAPFHVLDRRLIDSGWMDRLAAQKTELHVRSIFLQGLLLLPAGDRPKFFAQWEPLWTRWDRWLAANGVHPLAACLGCALSFPQISRIVVGVDSLEHLSAIIGATKQADFKWPADISCDDAKLLNPSQWLV